MPPGAPGRTGPDPPTPEGAGTACPVAQRTRDMGGPDRGAQVSRLALQALACVTALRPFQGDAP
jgi:hypothetical protein